MRDNIYIPVPAEEDLEATQRRREDYAVSRDRLAERYNESIAKRYDDNNDDPPRCIECGKVYSATLDSSIQLCPECR